MKMLRRLIMPYTMFTGAYSILLKTVVRVVLIATLVTVRMRIVEDQRKLIGRNGARN